MGRRCLTRMNDHLPTKGYMLHPSYMRVGGMICAFEPVILANTPVPLGPRIYDPFLPVLHFFLVSRKASITDGSCDRAPVEVPSISREQLNALLP